MEAKFDRAHPLGGDELSYWDKVELNRKYQCKHTDTKGVTHEASTYNRFSYISDVNFRSPKNSKFRKTNFCILTIDS